jgi:iron(III) transport system substrate-binding protein
LLYHHAIFHVSIRPTMFKKVLCLSLLAAASAAFAQEQVVNLYSARHYSTDEALYSNFTKATGIKINRVDADDAGILARLKAEGAASPADVILLVDAARLYKGEVDGLFQPVKSKLLDDAIPASTAPGPPPRARPGTAFPPGPA